LLPLNPGVPRPPLTIMIPQPPPVVTPVPVMPVAVQIAPPPPPAWPPPVRVVPACSSCPRICLRRDPGHHCLRWSRREGRCCP
jgi:hypothetical protein